MCLYITLIALTDDAAALGAVMARHGRAATPIDNASLRKALREGERQYLTAGRSCDCGSVLEAGLAAPEDQIEKDARDAARLRRKGWSEAKIARAVEGHRKAEARRAASGPDSFGLWEAVLRDLRDEAHLPYAGLFVHQYRGALATETFEPSRRDVPRNLPWTEALASTAEDEVTIFRFR